MSKITPAETVIPHSYEDWEGAASIPRIQELLGIGMKLEKVAERFQVSRHTITKTLKRRRQKRKAPTVQAEASSDSTEAAQSLNKKEYPTSAKLGVPAQKEA